MENLQDLIVAPSAQTVIVAKYVITIISLLFVPYISVLFGSTLFSLGFSARGRMENIPMFTRFSQDIAETFIPNFLGLLTLTVLPLLTIGVSFSEILYGADIQIVQFFAVCVILCSGAILLALLYRRSFQNADQNPMVHYLLGLATLGALTITVFAFVSSVTVVNFPEKWPRIQSIIPLTYDWNMLWRFMSFLTAALAMTGASILFFFLRWLGGKEGVEGEYRDYVRKFGGGVALGFAIVQTLFMVLYLATIPMVAKSHAVFYIAIAALLILLIITIMLNSVLRDGAVKLGTPVFALFMLFFLVVLVGENAARESSLIYQTYALEDLHIQKMAEIDAIRAERGGGGQASIEIGQELYNNKCSACHMFDQRVVGPPYRDVLPKYAGEQEKLTEFILNPVKVDASYPAMPSQGLKPHEAESAAMYLLQQYEETNK